MEAIRREEIKKWVKMEAEEIKNEEMGQYGGRRETIKKWVKMNLRKG